MAAELFYGVRLDPETKLPWTKADLSLGAWWRKVNGYKNPWSTGETMTVLYMQQRREWDKAHPMPVRTHVVDIHDDVFLVLPSPLYCEDNYPSGPLNLGPGDLTIDQKDYCALLNFCKEWDIKTQGAPAWWLNSYED